MRIVFFGSGKIAIPSLEALTKTKNEIVCVVTAQDRKKGRHFLKSFTPIKEFALKNELNIFQPKKLSSRDAIEHLTKTEPDIFIVFSFGRILSKDLLAIPKLYPLNIHASLLPKYRGAAPINFAVINGEKKTGITIIKMNEKLDEGDIALKTEIEIEYHDNAVTLEDKLAKLAAETIKEVLLEIENAKISFSRQDNNEASFAPKLKKDDGRINWNKQAEQIRNQIRGCLPWPGTFTFYKNKLIKIFSAEVSDTQINDNFLPGEIISLDKKGILVAATDKAIFIKELQIFSGKRLNAWQFIQGHGIGKGDKFD